MALIGIALSAIVDPLIQGRTAGWPAWTFVMLGATQALAITAWACLAPIAVAFALIFRLPMQAREPQV